MGGGNYCRGMRTRCGRGWGAWGPLDTHAARASDIGHCGDDRARDSDEPLRKIKFHRDVGSIVFGNIRRPYDCGSVHPNLAAKGIWLVRAPSAHSLRYWFGLVHANIVGVQRAEDRPTLFVHLQPRAGTASNASECKPLNAP